MKQPSSIAIFAVITLVAACASDRTLAPRGTVLTDQRVSTDVASSSGDAIASDIQGLETILTTAGANGGDIAKTAGPRPSENSSCAYSGGTGWWTCSPASENGVITARSYEYLDAAGKPMQFYNDLSTETVKHQIKSDGTVSRDTTFSGVIHRTRSTSVSGLTGKETSRKWNSAGASSDTVVHKDNGSTRKYAGTAADSLKNVIFPYPHTKDSYPLSGVSIRVTNYIVTATGKTTETRSVSRRVVTTYNGTADVQILLGTTTCTLHLDTHKVDGCVTK